MNKNERKERRRNNVSTHNKRNAYKTRKQKYMMVLATQKQVVPKIFKNIMKTLWFSKDNKEKTKQKMKQKIKWRRLQSGRKYNLNGFFFWISLELFRWCLSFSSFFLQQVLKNVYLSKQEVNIKNEISNFTFKMKKKTSVWPRTREFSISIEFLFFGACCCCSISISILIYFGKGNRKKVYDFQRLRDA